MATVQRQLMPAMSYVDTRAVMIHVLIDAGEVKFELEGKVWQRSYWANSNCSCMHAGL